MLNGAPPLFGALGAGAHAATARLSKMKFFCNKARMWSLPLFKLATVLSSVLRVAS
jgi:hypothetical protein